jgi:tripartite ATP-independent transporter DctM subunit
MSVETVTILMFIVLLVFLTTGMPIVFCLGTCAIIFTFFLWGPASLGVIANSMFSFMNNFILVCIPLFIFMAHMLERSGIADDLYSMMHKWFGPVRGGLAMGTVAICTVFAAMSGVSATGTLTMGLIALPSMLKRGYDKYMATGCIAAGGALGVLIPPSVPMVVYCLFANTSVGSMFLGGVFPGILLACLFVLYIAIRCGINPKLGPPLPKEERANWASKMVSLRAVILPILLVLGVLGSIFTGIATPTEAAGVGAFGSVVCAAIYKRLTWKGFKEAAVSGGQTTAMVLWIIGGAAAFSAIYTGLGATELIRNTMANMEVNRWVIMIAMQLSLFVLGCFLDPNGIMMITLPIYLPIVSALGFDLTWFGILFVMNMEMGYLTPPFGWNLFYLKGVAPPEISIQDIYRAIIPFVGIQALGLIMVMVVPDIAMYLPNMFNK